MGKYPRVLRQLYLDTNDEDDPRESLTPNEYTVEFRSTTVGTIKSDTNNLSDNF